MRNTKAIKYAVWFITALSLSVLLSTKWETMLTIHKPPRPRVYRPADQTSIPHTEKLESPIEDITEAGSDKIIIPTFASIKEARLKSSNVHKVSKPEEGTVGLINTRETTIIVKNAGVIKVGDIFSVIIEARDSKGRHRLKGGDFWMANIRSRQVNAAGKIIDFNNGTYEVVFFAAWAGKVRIEIILVHPSETTDFIENSIWPMKDRALWKGTFVSGNTRGSTACRFRIKGEVQGKCEWSHPLAIGKTVFVCDKPSSQLGCDKLVHLKSSSHVSTPNYDLLKEYTGIFSRSLNYATLPNTPVVNILPAGQNSSLLEMLSLPECKANLPPPLIDGFWTSGSKWTSLQCKTRQWTRPEIIQCLKGKELILMGDSTTRQWRDGILKLMRVGKSQYTKQVTPKHTTHHSDIMAFDFYFHPYSIGSVGYPYRVGKWEYEVLDNLNFTACNYVVMVSPWAHYTQWVKESTWERMHLLRETLIRFMKRCPNAQVMVKTPHPRYHQKGGEVIYSGEKLLYDIYELYYELFSDLGIHIIDIWDMNSAYPHPNVIHMPMPVIYQEIFMLFSHICPKGPPQNNAAK